MNLQTNTTYKLKFPNGSQCIAKYVQKKEYSFMPSDYMFKGLDGEFPKHSGMYPEFALPEFAMKMIEITPVSGDFTSNKRELQVIIDEYLNLPLTDPKATELEVEMWEQRSSSNKELLRETLMSRLAMIESQL